MKNGSDNKKTHSKTNHETKVLNSSKKQKSEPKKSSEVKKLSKNTKTSENSPSGNNRIKPASQNKKIKKPGKPAEKKPVTPRKPVQPPKKLVQSDKKPNNAKPSGRPENRKPSVPEKVPASQNKKPEKSNKPAEKKPVSPKKTAQPNKKPNNNKPSDKPGNRKPTVPEKVPASQNKKPEKSGKPAEKKPSIPKKPAQPAKKTKSPDNIFDEIFGKEESVDDFLSSLLDPFEPQSAATPNKRNIPNNIDNGHRGDKVNAGNTPEISKIDNQIKECDEKLKKLQSKKEKLESEIKKIKDSILKYEKQKEIENVNSQIQEIKKQKRELNREKNEIIKAKNREAIFIESLNDDIDAEDDYFDDSMSDLQERKNEEQKETNRKELEEIETEIEESKRSTISDLNEWNQLYKELLNSLKNEKLYGRKRIALYKVRLIKESNYKKEAYITYLNEYKQALDYTFNKSPYGEIIGYFETKLPEDFPYRGKVYTLNYSNLYSRVNKQEKNITLVNLYTYENGLKISALINEIDLNLLENNKDKEFPFMVTSLEEKHLDNGNIFLKVHISNDYGEIKASIGNENGIRTTVQRFIYNKDTHEKFYYLTYKSSRIHLKLNRDDLITERSSIPIGSSLRVYVKDADFALDDTVTVTERMEESLVIDYFDEVIVAIEQDEMIELRKYLEEIGYDEPLDEWYFHPSGNKITDLSEIIIANSNFGLRVTFEKINDEILCLRYKELLKDVSNYGTHADIMVSTKIVFNVVNIVALKINSNKYINYSHECNRLKKYLIDEFLTQKNVAQKDYENGRFIESWKNVTHFLLKLSADNSKLFTIRNIYQRHLDELQRFSNDKSTNELVKDAILNPGSVKNYNTDYAINFFFNEKINNNIPQQEAIKKALLSEYFYIIQGPPGTGKTTIIREIIQQQLFHNPSSRILVTSQTDVALDNVLRGLKEFICINDGITSDQIIRCNGGIGKIANDILPYSFDVKYKRFKEQYREEISNNPISNEIRKEWFSLLDINSKFEDLIKEHFLKQFKVIGTTCVGLADNNLGFRNIKFDLVIIDEASQILPGDMVIPINRAKKVIVVGDHKQLSARIDSRLITGKLDVGNELYGENQDDFFKKTLFEQIFEKTPDDAKTVLKIQYRMPPVLVGLVNLFYDNVLESGDICYKKDPLILNSHLIFLDLRNDSMYREKIVENKRIINPYEVTVVKSIINKLRSNNILNRIVILVAYKSQVNEIRNSIDEKKWNAYVSTIEDFQGREEDIVIFCMTNTKKTLFFSDERRLNVAFSRARNTLILIGSSYTFESYDDSQKIKQAFNYIKENGKIIDYKDFN